MAIDGKALSLGDRDLFAGWQQPVSNSYYSGSSGILVAGGGE